MEQIAQKRQPASSARRLAAIMFTDIVGYTALMGEGSAKALELVGIVMDIQKPLVEKHNGQWLKEMGDGAMAKFSSALDAVNCAIEIQEQARVKLDGKLRIGIHLGDITIKENDVYGDGVNVASRLESIADPGGIYISDAIFKAIQGQTDVKTQYLGEVRLKNVRYEVRTYALQGEGLPVPSVKLDLKHRSHAQTNWLIIIALLALSAAAYFFYQNNINKVAEDPVKTVAVLPFQNISNDSETAYFVNGIMRVILDNLAQIGDLKVTAGKAVEPYAEGYPSAKEVGQKLNVDYLIETKVEKVDNKIKIMVQLVDTKDEHHIWDETYDREWKDVLKLQSDLSLNIARNLNTTLTDPEIKMIRAADDIDPQAQDFLFKAWNFANRGGLGEKQKLEWAIEMTKKAIAVDSAYTVAWMVLGDMESLYYFYGHDVSDEQKQRVKYAYDQSLLLQPESFDVQLNQAQYLYQIEHDYPKALQIYEQLDNQYPQKTWLKNRIGNTYRRLGDFEKASQYYSELILDRPSWEGVRLNYGQTLAILRHYKEAEQVLTKVIAMEPDFTDAYQELAEVQIDIDGDLNRARETLSKPFLQKYLYLTTEIELRQRHFNKTLALWHSAPEESLITQSEFTPKSLGLALVYYLAGNDSAQALFKESLEPLLAKVKETPDDWRLHISLGLAYAGLGEKQKAMETVSRVNELITRLNDALMTPVIEQGVFRIYIMIKEYDLALELIEDHLQRPVFTGRFGGFSINDLKLHPMFDPLRELPAFQALLENPKYQINLEED